MRRNNNHRFALLYPLIGLAATLSLPGCAAAPMISMASQYIKPTTTGGTTASSTDMLASLAQRVGFMLPAQPGAMNASTMNAGTTTATAGTGSAASAGMTTSGKSVAQ